MDGGEVASGTECTIVSGTRVMPSRSFARVLASSVRLGLAHCGEAALAVVPGTRTTPDMSPGGVPALLARSGSTADKVPPPAWPWLPHLRLPVAGTTGVFLFRRGEMPSWRSPPSGEPLTVVVIVLRREEYHVVAAVEGHELETPEAEHRPGLKRLLKSTHLELNGKVFVNT
jgi:hypothetical protein